MVSVVAILSFVTDNTMRRAVLGLIIGAVLVQKASYHWVFWFSALIAVPVALGSVFIIPADVAKYDDKPETYTEKWKSLDLIGISILTGVPHVFVKYSLHAELIKITAALILFIYGVTSGSANGWAVPGVLIPLIISILLMAAFFYWETLIPSDKAAMYVTASFDRIFPHELLVLWLDHLRRGFIKASPSSLVQHCCRSFGGI
jgi:MFS family permease